MSSARAIALQKADRLGVFALTGGGTSLANELLTTAGASKTVLEVTVPYAEAALADYLGGPPERASSQPTARALAMAAFQRARTLIDQNAGGTARQQQRCFGLACTASLTTDRAKRGTTRAHLALQTTQGSWDQHLELPKGRSREHQEKLVVHGLWRLLSEALGVELEDRLLQPAITSQTATRGKPGWRALVLGSEKTLPAAGFTGEAQPPKLLLPGSFNPLHEGHRGMLGFAEQALGLTGAYELSIANVDKPPLDYSTLRERLVPFQGRSSAGPLWLTRLPTFVEKASAFPGVTFAVGADTMLRIGQVKYYDGEAGLKGALKELAALETRFLVFGRRDGDRFLTLKDLSLPRALRKLCQGVDERAFRKDLSSTELRRARG